MISHGLAQILIGSKSALIGPPCCGKGTLIQSIVQKIALPRISTSEILRSHRNKDEEIRKCMRQGKLIPDHIVINSVLEELHKLKSGFILDGFPRTTSQAEALHRYFPDLRVYQLNVSDETVMERFSGRLTCSSCSFVFNRKFCPPKKEGICDHCDEHVVHRLVHRPDDTIDVAEKRLENYHTHSKPVIDFCSEHGMLTVIETEGLTSEQIFHKFLEAAHRL